MNETVPEQSAWMEIAAELRRIADDAEKLADQPAPPHFELNIQPWSADGYRGVTPKGRAATITSVDAVSVAFLGKPAGTSRLNDGTFFHKVGGRRGRVSFSIYQSIADPKLLDKDEEIEQLRARIADLEAEG